MGRRHVPSVPSSAQLLSSIAKKSVSDCAVACNTNPLCRIFDYGAVISQQCRLFEGDIDTLGTIIPSSSSDSIVGTVQITPSLFTQYGQSCSSVCDQTRYLTCINSICRCPPHTYWNSSAGICRAQSPILGIVCEQGVNMCREDLNYTCLQFNQCGPLSVLSGKTVVDRNTAINGSAGNRFQAPFAISFSGVGENESLLIVDNPGVQILYMKNVNSNGTVIPQVVARNNANFASFSAPVFALLDVREAKDLYVSDYGSRFVALFPMMQMINPAPRIIINSAQCDRPGGLAMDQQQTLYISDADSNRILRLALNATSAVVIAGTGVPGSSSMTLFQPRGIFLDEKNSMLYVADAFNHRIQAFHLNGTPPYKGTTVAGGNGAGSGSHQLNSPRAVWVSKKTGAIYIADTDNHRIQRWNRGASRGFTLAGSPLGVSGSNAAMLNSPYGLAVNADETHLYVCDSDNSRVQRFDLI